MMAGSDTELMPQGPGPHKLAELLVDSGYLSAHLDELAQCCLSAIKSGNGVTVSNCGLSILVLSLIAEIKRLQELINEG